MRPNKVETAVQCSCMLCVGVWLGFLVVVNQFTILIPLLKKIKICRDDVFNQYLNWRESA